MRETVRARATRDEWLMARRAPVWLAIAFVCLVSSWYFAAVIAPAGLGANAPTVKQGLFPEWYGSREMLLQSRDPYSTETTKEIQAGIYGEALRAYNYARNQHRFAYPVFFAFFFFPLAILPFSAAELVALAGCIAATALSVTLWRQRSDLRLDGLVCGVFVFASYPVVLGLQLRQPTLIIAALLAGVVYCVRSNRLMLAGILAALSTCKPQLAIAVLLPLSIWSIAEWRARKRFLTAAAGGLATLLLASELACSGWFTRWLWTLRAYTQYAGTRPLLADVLHGHFVVSAGVVLVGAVVWVSYRYCDQNLLFAVCFSIAAFQLLFSFQIYNEVLLVPVALWLAGNGSKIQSRGQLHILCCSCTWIVLGVGWTAAIGLSVANLVAPGPGLTLWQVPLLAAWLYPLPVFVTLALYALPVSWRLRRTESQAMQPL